MNLTINSAIFDTGCMHVVCNKRYSINYLCKRLLNDTIIKYNTINLFGNNYITNFIWCVCILYININTIHLDTKKDN